MRQASGSVRSARASTRHRAEPAFTPTRIGMAGGASGLMTSSVFFPTANIARVDAPARRAAASSFDGDTCIEMHVGDHRQGASSRTPRQIGQDKRRGMAMRTTAAGHLKRANLTQVRLHVVGGSVEHRLYDARGAAHGNSTTFTRRVRWFDATRRHREARLRPRTQRQR